jgi:hypothetical protein
MSEVCAELHRLARRGTQYTFPFDVGTLPHNGIYVLFERGEDCHGGPRIVRVGTHTGDRQLRSRVLQHFVKENKDRSIFRKNIGRALLNRAGDSYLAEWNHDRTSRAGRALYGEEPDPPKRRAVETDVTAYMRGRFSFIVFKVDDKSDRLSLESRLISTVSLCAECGPSTDWLGRFSPKDKIRVGGLWLVNELGKVPLSADDLSRLAAMAV